MKKTFFLSFAILLILMTTASVAQANPTSSGVPTLTELRNATYTGTGDEPVSLVEGHWEGEPYVEGGAARPRAGLVDNVYYTGDLDGDGTQKAVVILWRSGAGTGVNTYVMVMARQNGEIENIGTALIGDRVKLRGGKIVDGKVILEVLQAGENDAMCCPTMLATRTWSMQGDQLVEGEIEMTGKLSLAALEGTEWVLTHMNRNQPVPEGAEVTLAFSNGRIAGKSACNRYSAGVEEGESASNIHIGQSMSTMMACPDELMRIERQYLDALLNVTSFSFLAGGLVLSGQKKDGSQYSLLFSKAVKNMP